MRLNFYPEALPVSWEWGYSYSIEQAQEKMDIEAEKSAKRMMDGTLHLMTC